MTRRCALAWLLAAAAVAAACGSNPLPPTGPGPTPPVTPPPQPPPPAPPPPTLAVSRILAFGDSMTEGVASPPPSLLALDWTLPSGPGRSESYPFKLKALIDARYTGQTITVLNGGLAGRQARDDRERFSGAMREARPDLVLLLEGVNDLNQDLKPGEGDNARIRSVVSALEDMGRESQEFRGIPILIGTLPPQRAGAPKAWSVHLLPDFNESLRTMAATKGFTVVEISQLPLSLIGQDGLHPSEAGYQRMAEIWLDAIKAKYERAPTTTAR